MATFQNTVNTCSCQPVQIHKEEWREIPGYEEIYEVSSYGRIRRTHEALRPRCTLPAGHEMKPALNRKGYLQIRLNRHGMKRISIGVHRLVMLAFVGQSSLQVNHKNGIKTDNNLPNLEYVTNRENRLHSFYVLGQTKVFGGHTVPSERRPRGLRNGKYTKPEATPRGCKHGMSKLNDEKVRQIRSLYAAHTLSSIQLAGKFGVSKHTILEVIHRRTWTHIV